MMAQVIIHETRQPTDEVLERHRRVFEDSGMRVLEEPQVELVPNPDYVEGSDAPREFYRLTFQVEAPRRKFPELRLCQMMNWLPWYDSSRRSSITTKRSYDRQVPTITETLTSSLEGGVYGTTST